MGFAWKFRLVGLMLVVLLSGCAFRSQHVLRQSSLGFNKALQHTLGEQMLLNLVRLRYGESPVFLEVTSISSQYSYSGTISGKADIKEVSPDSYGINLGFTFAEKPTFTLIPLQGEKFARRLLSPIPIDHLILLLNSGWRVDRVLRLCVQSLNGIPNAPTASGPTPEEAPQFEEFLELVYKLEALRKNGKLRFAYVKKENQAIPALILSGQGSLEKEVREMLGLIDAPYYPLVGLEDPKGPSVIQFETRSLIGVLFYLSHGIEIPVKDLEAGKAIITRDQDGRYFSWQRLLGDLFNIHQNEQLPSEAIIAVKYRERWYYISDQDTSTKSTFILLQQLFALEASKGKGMAPLLTLPVN